jgi:excisionase family DNA binding protein
MSAQAEGLVLAQASGERLAYSIDEIATMLGVSPELTRKEIARGRLRASKLGRRVVISRAEATRYLESTQVGAR